MKLIIFLLMAILVFSSQAMAMPIPVRGVVEGFYGSPWTFEQRLDMVQFIGSKGMNAYIYAPKDDPYHREKWREPYPAEQCQALINLNQEAEKAGVQLIFAMSPGLDIDFSGVNRDADREAMVQKLNLMYENGIRQFALFFDDIPSKNAQGQAAFINYIENVFIKKHDDIRPLIIVPTEYYLTNMVNDGEISEYTSTMENNTSRSTVFLYTGYGCCPDGLSKDDINKFKSYYKEHSVGVWWNYPVNDYMPEKPALGPLDKMPKNPNVEMFFINPMDRFELSKIAIATGAEYTNNPDEYYETKAWMRALDEQYGDNAFDMMLFAEANQRLENSWAAIGRQDTPNRTRLYQKIADSTSAVDKMRLKYLLIEDTKERIAAYERLQKNLPEKVLQECALDLAKGIENYKAELSELEK